MADKKEHVEGIGEVTFIKSRRAKNIGISIKPFSGVKVTVPYLVSHKAAMKVLLSKLNWVQKHLPKIESIESQKQIFNESSDFNTKHHSLKIESWDKDSFRTNILQGIIWFRYPQNIDIYSADTQTRIRKAIEKTWKLEGEEYFAERIDFLAQKFGFKYSSLTVKNTKSKWGSCSHDNHILLSLHLMRVPAHLQDYVILHELCHTKEKNHQTPFWDLMNTVTKGQAKVLDKEMKSYSTRIY
jgi:predicted metal-dependent hydrolase